MVNGTQEGIECWPSTAVYHWRPRRKTPPKTTMKILASTVLVLVLIASARAATFDCDKAWRSWLRK